MLEVWGRKNSSNVIPVLWAVAELGLAHNRHNVGGSFGGLETDAYGAMNPNRTIPTINDDGFVLWESNAIVRHLCRQYGAGSLWPEKATEVALADQWMEWSKANVMMNLIQVFFALVRSPAESRDAEKVRALVSAVTKTLRLLESHLAGQDFVVGNNLTMGDIPLGAAINKYFVMDIERPSLPNIEAWYARLSEREPYRKHAMNPIGTSPEEWLELEKAGA
jgi:glutathione S-transferase